MLLLQIPAWAHHLYLIQKVSGEKYEALTDCPFSARFKSTALNPQTVTGTKIGTQQYQGNPAHKYRISAVQSGSVAASPDNVTVTCLTRTGAVLPMTGRSMTHQLVLGIGLLLLGSLFVALTVRPSLAGFRRRRPRPTTPS